MTYALSVALQKAVYAALSADAALQALVGTAVFDAPPAGSIPALYVSLGPERARERSDRTVQGARHDFVISVVTDAGGFQEAKAVAGAVSDVLASALPALDRGRVVTLNFVKARARRDEAGQQRRIDMTFRALLDDD
ncbi:hypothetical protein OB2597_04565 [Pseudooceanicola batsensis HTCC2597]|uniref:Gene transfer agent protein n=1 Tax=Pseudooceanicola batsensis (strain ATCC BAA-863 / DSM 15984 / KCTC 12145 / HTCC2597) TaxID=252305 RepID=A3U3P5_PSEBH|nr:DUF3168 domain-containing protein [Pseudooceanicola batsensis]EAQ01247.1 hypothetical protein OB2597_04565 [Pseudooceanicola batsensis HTCC2597]